jgi:hypothetical protein
MKPVVSAFNAWTWYVASLERMKERTLGIYTRAGEARTTN